MSDCSPLKLTENGQSSPSQSLGSQSSHASRIETRTRQTDNTETATYHPQEIERSRFRSSSESSSTSGQVRYGAKNVIELFVPVTICMLIVVTIMKATDSYHYSSQSAIWYGQMMYTEQSDDAGIRALKSFANAFIMLAMIIVMTTVLILLYKFKCYATIHGWLILSSLMLLFIFATVHITEILKVYNIPMDIYTIAIFLWNFGVVGMVCIHWKGPLLLQQGYLILISAFMALIFIQCLPDWTIWTVLGIVSIWDLVAVLAPRGPLRILVETAQERNESIFPALIYSSTMVWETIITTIPSIMMADNGDRSSSTTKSTRNKNQSDRSNQPSSPAQSSRRKNRPTQSVYGTPKKRDQHPVEIHYEGGAEPPEVAFIQPSLSSTSNTNDNWQRPIIRAVNSGSNWPNSVPESSRHRNPHNENADQATEAAELTINLPQNQARVEHQQQNQSEEERGVKLGLGDFIFYSVLVGKASSYGDWTTTVSCYVAILVGLSVTLSLLAIFKKALPALPISIAFGMCSFFLSSVFVVPFAEKLTINQIFI